MAATTKIRPQSRRRVKSIDLPVKANVKILGGTIVVTDATGFAVMATAAANLHAWGPAQETKDNTGGANGALKVSVDLSYELDVQLWENDTATPVTAAMIGTQVFMLDNQTLTAAAAGASAGPFVYEVTSEGVWAFFKP